MRIDYSVRGLGFDDFYRAVHRAGVKVCASWWRPDFFTAIGRIPYDCLTFHSYASGGGLQTATPLTAYTHLRDQVSSKVAYEHHLATRLRRGSTAASHRFLLVTEYGTLDAVPQQLKSHYNDLLLAQQMFGLVESGARVANISNVALLQRLVNGTTYLSSFARLLQLVDDLSGLQPKVLRMRGVPSLVKVLATRSRAVTRVLVLDMRTGPRSYRPVLRIPGVSGTQCVEVRRLSGALDASDIPVPATGLPATAHLGSTTWRSGTTYRPIFRAHSVTSLTISRKGREPCSPPTTW